MEVTISKISKMSNKVYFLVFILTLAGVVLCADDTATTGEDAATLEEGEKPITEEELEYAKGSLCGYCTYCKFCKLCDEDCPCTTGPGKPNCHMCKYCKYCKFCSMFCDTICKPGGMVDTISSTIMSALPTYNKEEIDKDLDGVKDYIKDKDEL
ncbi:unnamed protein product [Owenia fusiformis]|uniref:Uncharacterized protein n=1 Tax=Owenia fusiformis TaxID=6347 RepID=A0A8S4P9A9_OWEFU|nr:unnamed protein product [Owenia fusiformis]